MPSQAWWDKLGLEILIVVGGLYAIFGIPALIGWLVCWLFGVRTDKPTLPERSNKDDVGQTSPADSRDDACRKAA
jgi:hypothetical protein